MKFIKYILTLVVAVATLSSCNYLDKEPDTELTMDMVFQDKDRMEGMLAYVYSGIPDPYWGLSGSGGYGCAALADDLRPSYLWYQWNWDCNRRAVGVWATNTSWAGNVWADVPRKIREAQVFMQNVKPIPEDAIDQNEVDLMKLECRALIAYYYWWFLYWYGPCPFVPGGKAYDTSTPIEELKIGQRPWDEIVDWIDQELKEVGDQLPASYSQDKKFGRVTKLFCACTRARVLLFSASKLVNGNPMYADHVNNLGENLFPVAYDENKWTRAMQACKDVIDIAEAEGYKLYVKTNPDGSIDPFMSVIGAACETTKNGNTEVLFARPSSNANEFAKHCMPYGNAGNGAYSVSQSLVDAFAMSDGLYPILGYEKDANGYNTIPVINPATPTYNEDGFSTQAEYRNTQWTGAKEYNAARGGSMITDVNTFNMYVGREPRFYATINYNEKYFKPANRKVCFYNSSGGKTFNDIVGHSINDNIGTHDAPNNGYLNAKGFLPTDDNKGSYSYKQGTMYALPEFYLSYVECLLETNPTHPDVLKYWNLIRERAGVRPYTWGAATQDEIQISKDKNEMMELLRRERRVELCCLDSSIRLTDIRRWMIGDEIADGWDYYHGGMNFTGIKRSADASDPDAFFVRKTNGLKRVWKDEYYWMPVFQTEIDKNENLVQAPFWENAVEE